MPNLRRVTTSLTYKKKNKTQKQQNYEGKTPYELRIAFYFPGLYFFARLFAYFENNFIGFAWGPI